MKDYAKKGVSVSKGTKNSMAKKSKGSGESSYMRSKKINYAASDIAKASGMTDKKKM